MKKPVYRKARIRPDHSKPKNPTGRPPHVPTEESRGQVKTLVIGGATAKLIAKVIKIAEPTLRKHYASELETSEIMVRGSIARNLVNKALGNGPAAVTAAIFYLKTHGWKEAAQDLNVKGIQVTIAKDDFSL